MSKYWAELHTACGAKQTIPLMEPSYEIRVPLTYFLKNWLYKKDDPLFLQGDIRTFSLDKRISEFTYLYRESK